MTTLGLGLGAALAPLGTPITANVTYRAVFYAEVTESSTVGDGLLAARTAIALDTLQASALPIAVRGVAVLLADGVDVANIQAVSYGLRVLELLAITKVIADNSIGGVVTTDTLELSEAIFRGASVSASDGLTITDTLGVVAGVAVIEALGLTETVLGSARGGITVTELFELADTLGRFLGGEIADAIDIAETLAGRALFSGVLADTVDVEPSTTARFLLGVIAADTLELTATQALKAIFAPTLNDTLQVTAGYVSPDGNFTAWAMNTRTAAVSEYSNYVFNSFGVLDGKSVGATSDGLYELVGDDDAGDAIIAQIKSGFLQFGGTKLSRLKAAYLATRGDAEFVLRIETGLGELYNYAVSTRDMRSTKVHMGKGQRARYFSFELISAGEDFDIDTLEFVPIVMARRV